MPFAPPPSERGTAPRRVGLAQPMIHSSNTRALELCKFDAHNHLVVEHSEHLLSFGDAQPFAVEVHFYCQPHSKPIAPPGHQQGPAQWHGHQVLISKFNGCVSGEYRIGLDAQRRVIFQREVSPWIVTTTDTIPLREWHSVVCTYDGNFMRIYIDCRHAAHIACGPQKIDLATPTLIGADLCGYATAHHFEGYISEVSMWQRSLDAADVRALAAANPLNSESLSRDLIAYWCIFQREHISSPIKNCVRLAGEEQFHANMCFEGPQQLDLWRDWMADAGEQLPVSFAPVLNNDSGDGPTFSKNEGLHFIMTASASDLSFGSTLPFSVAVLFKPLGPQATKGGVQTVSGVTSEQSCGILVSKFHAGLRGEYRIGVDAHGCPFFHREVSPWAIVSPTSVEPDQWHEVVATYDGHKMRLYVDRRHSVSTLSGAQFTDQVSPVIIGAEYGEESMQNHFEGHIGDVRIWNRALSSKEVPTCLVKMGEVGGNYRSSNVRLGMLALWQPGACNLGELDGRVILRNVGKGKGGSYAMDGILKRHMRIHPLEMTLRVGVRGVLVELGTVVHHSEQWRRAVDMISSKQAYKHYCYLGTSVSLQKSLLQALDMYAHDLIHQKLKLSHVNDTVDYSLKKLEDELRLKRVDVRGRGSQLFRDWFFENPISFLRECDGDRCEFWRFRYPNRRIDAMQVLVDQVLERFPPKDGEPLVISSFGSGLLYQEWCHVNKLIERGYRHFRLVLVDTAYAPWKQKYLARDGCCRIYVQPSNELYSDMLRPAPTYTSPGTPRETLESTAATAVNNAISFVMFNDAIFQFVQWFSSCPDVNVQILLYDSVDAYVADCQMAPNEVMGHVCSAIDYKDNDKLLEDFVNHMAAHTLRRDGVCVKLVTLSGENSPGIYVEDCQRRLLFRKLLDASFENHFAGLCQECTV